MIIRLSIAEERDKILAFYQACNYGGEVKADDLIICAEIDKQIIALVRLCKEKQTLVLRGMQVKKQFQRQGIGKALLKELDKIIKGQTCYCLPYGHLEHFYSKIGFKKVEDNNVPDHLLKRLEGYRLKDPNMMIMKRQGYA